MNFHKYLSTKHAKNTNALYLKILFMLYVVSSVFNLGKKAQ